MRRFGMVLFVMAVLLCAVTVWSATESMSVQVRSTELRDSPSFLGRPVAPVVYGERVEVLDQQGDWMQVDASSGRKGWIHLSALTKKRIVFSSGAIDAKPAASGEELSLAGKGFNADVEEKFKMDREDLDFTWVDKMQQMEVSSREMISFLKEGGLQPQRGGEK